MCSFIGFSVWYCGSGATEFKRGQGLFYLEVGKERTIMKYVLSPSKKIWMWRWKWAWRVVEMAIKFKRIFSWLSSKFSCLLIFTWIDRTFLFSSSLMLHSETSLIFYNFRCNLFPFCLNISVGPSFLIKIFKVSSNFILTNLDSKLTSEHLAFPRFTKVCLDLWKSSGVCPRAYLLPNTPNKILLKSATSRSNATAWDALLISIL